MRRFIPTLLLVFVILVAGGALILLQGTGGGATVSSSMLPTILATLAALAGLILVGYLVAQVFNLVARLFGRAPDVQPDPAKAAAAKPANVFLYDRQSLLVFTVATVVLVFGFLITRALAANVPPGYPLDRVPDLSSVLFSIPTGPTSTFEVLEWHALVALIVLALGGILVVGIVLSFLAQSGEAATRRIEAVASATPAAKPAPAARPAPGAQKPAPVVPFLYENRQHILFYVIVGVVVLAFLLVRWQATGTPLAYPFDGSVRLDSVIMTLPGDIEGWPEGLPGPGQPLLVWQALASLAGAIVSVLIVGFLLARGIVALDNGIRTSEKATGQWPAPQVAKLETAIKEGAAQPRRLNGLDQIIIVLIGAIVVLLAVWVVPTIGGMVSVDTSVEQTRVASFWTPTPLPGPTATPGPSPDEAVAALPAGDAAKGKTLTEQQGCVACHIPNPDTPDAKLAGSPWVASASEDGKGIADHATERIAASDYTGTATSPEAYLYESIVNPSAFVVPGFVDGVMPKTYGGALSAQDLADIIAYLKTVR